MPDGFLGLSVTLSTGRIGTSVHTAMTTVDNVMIATTEPALVEGLRFSVPNAPSPGRVVPTIREYQEERGAKDLADRGTS